MKKSIAVFLVCVSCTLHPPYERPCFESPEKWRVSLDTEGAADIRWWTGFQDDVLNQLIYEALVNNQNLQIAIARVDQFQAQLGIVRSKFYPQIELNALADRQKDSSSITALPTGTPQIYNSFGFLFQASYLVDLWGEVRSAAEAAYHEWLASVEARRTTVLMLISSVANTYVQLRQFDQQLLIGEKTLETRKTSHQLAKVRFELGFTSEMTVSQAFAEVKSAEAEVEQLLLAVAETENLLNVLLGRSPAPIARGLTLDCLSMPPAVPTCLPSEIVCQRPDLLSVEQQLIAAGARIGVARAQFFPKFTLNGGIGYESIQLGTLLNHPSKMWDLGATILQEIFTGGRLTYDVKRTEAMQREALHQYLAALFKAFKEVNDAFIAHKMNLEKVETQSQRVEALQNYLRLAWLRYQEGQTDYLTFLDAERQYFRSQLDYEEARGASFRSFVQIYQALGGGWVMDADTIATTID